MQDPLGALNVVSADGTPIVAYAHGNGPPLLLVHGTAEKESFWKPMVPYLEPAFTVYVMQRRGRGKSGDSATHSLAKEGEDISALLEAIGEPAVLFGHGYGANCVLEAMPGPEMARNLILCEPRVEFPYSDGAVEKMEVLLSEGEKEEVILKFFAESDLSLGEVMDLRSEQGWEARTFLASTIPRECRAESAFTLDIDKLSEVQIPTLLLTGANSAAAVKKGAEALASVLPAAVVQVLEGQPRNVIQTDPATVSSLILDFVH